MQFAGYYYKKSISENDYQPNLLEENINNEDINFPIGPPKKTTLINMHKTVIRRNQRIVLRYCKPNKHLHPEKVCMLSSATVLLVFEGK